MNLSFSKNLLVVFFLISALLFSACTKIVNTDIGGGLIPPVDGVNTKEMFLDVVSKNAADTITRVGTADDHALGYIGNDPIFGTISASINLQLKPSVFPFYFPVSSDSMIADSVVLVLSCRGIWGDSTQPLSFRVFSVLDNGGDTLSEDSIYTTNYNVASGLELTENHTAKTVVDPRTLNDSIKPDPFMEKAANQLRIRLDKDYATNTLFKIDTSVYNDDSLLDIAMKGFKVVPEANPISNALLKINLLDTNTKLAIYFRYKDPDSTGKMDTTVRYFRCNQYTCGSSNYIQRSRTQTVLNALPPLSNGVANDSLLYIDGNPGIYARLQIPGLENLSNKIIHRAEILMEQDPDEANPNEHYFTPPNLFLAAYSTDSAKRFILPNDVSFGSATYYTYVSNQTSLGCFPFTKKDSITGTSIYAYRFAVSRYVQGIITRHETSYPLILWAPSVRDFIKSTSTATSYTFTGTINSSGTTIPLNAPAFGRVRLGGGGNSLHRMRLRIVYSDL